jgi:hypothetical protein
MKHHRLHGTTSHSESADSNQPQSLVLQTLLRGKMFCDERKIYRLVRFTALIVESKRG